MIFLRFIVSNLITIHNNNVFKNFEMIIHEFDGERSEERRVGKVCVG